MSNKLQQDMCNFINCNEKGALMIMDCIPDIMITEFELNQAMTQCHNNKHFH